MNFIRNLFFRTTAKDGGPVSPAVPDDEPPLTIAGTDGAAAFRIARHIAWHEGFPYVDWSAVAAWSSGLASTDGQAEAWTAAERAWLFHMRGALGDTFHLSESPNALLLSSLDRHVARATIDYMERTLKRVVAVLAGVASVPPQGKDILIVLDDEESYYRYVAHYYPEDGEFAFSGGMHIDQGCSHYVTVKSDLHAIEPVIAHEMTHGCLGHLPLPLWLNEGLAVNTERRLAGTRSTLTPAEMRGKHRAFWNASRMQEFWSGESFYRADDGNLLSYDLACVMVEQMAREWERFRPFVLSAQRADSGAAAASAHLDLELGEFACALLEREPSAQWFPDPSAWDNREGPG